MAAFLVRTFLRRKGKLRENLFEIRFEDPGLHCHGGGTAMEGQSAGHSAPIGMQRQQLAVTRFLCCSQSWTPDRG